MLKTSELDKVMDTFMDNTDNRLITRVEELREYLKSLNNLDLLDSEQLLTALYKKESENRKKCLVRKQINNTIEINLKKLSYFRLNYHKLYYKKKNVIDFDNYRYLISTVLNVVYNNEYEDVPKMAEEYNILSDENIEYYKYDVGMLTTDNNYLVIKFDDKDKKDYFLKNWKQIDK